MATAAQILANIQNAQKSTGPRTAEGKARVRLNALRHGQAAQTIILPGEQAADFHAFKEEFVAGLAPEGVLETQLAVALADSQWRIYRLHAQEHAMFALGHEQHASQIATSDDVVDAALTGALTLCDQMDNLAKLGMYEQRIYRMFHSTLKLFLELQARRLEAAS